MVLFLKHVHLQNLGAAGFTVLVSFRAGFSRVCPFNGSLQEAEASAISAARRSTSSWIRAMAVLDAANRTRGLSVGRGRAAVVASELSWDYGFTRPRCAARLAAKLRVLSSIARSGWSVGCRYLWPHIRKSCNSL